MTILTANSLCDCMRVCRDERGARVLVLLENADELRAFEQSFALQAKRVPEVLSTSPGRILFKNGSSLVCVNSEEYLPEISSDEHEGYKQILVGKNVTDSVLARVASWVGDRNSYEADADPNNDSGFALFLSGDTDN